ncbi:hypothetical protein GNI_017480 [Gregarina niphandrodes]|uniref:Uncharacterized protein n=1 Tax=Gregarina niphandrodes TaxID=110365 RepID=A0A023BC36_GRENI|nr:hypothetical protein GNI_017480 [Gregarina niphandrodes]EZG82120.1 hypothetical protein GNI_017480 [Gregarina niphandrodes]|eukprot:XP_011129038.1 hypothetical protein GNI_017480 [Gregarina niphandrodes]
MGTMAMGTTTKGVGATATRSSGTGTRAARPRAFFPTPSLPSSYVVSSRDVNEPPTDPWAIRLGDGAVASDSHVLDVRGTARHDRDADRAFHYGSERLGSERYGSEHRPVPGSKFTYVPEHYAPEHHYVPDQYPAEHYAAAGGPRRALKDSRRRHDSSRPTTVSARPTTYDDRRRHELLEMIKRKRDSYRDASLADDSSS